MELPAFRRLIASIPAAVSRLVRSVGGWLSLLVSVLWILTLGVLRPALELFTKERAVRESAWLRLLRLAMAKVLKVAGRFWDLALTASAEADQLGIEGGTVADIQLAKHRWVSARLEKAGMTDETQRDRLIQAVVWTRRVESWLRLLRA